MSATGDKTGVNDDVQSPRRSAWPASWANDPSGESGYQDRRKGNTPAKFCSALQPLIVQNTHGQEEVVAGVVEAAHELHNTAEAFGTDVLQDTLLLKHLRLPGKALVNDLHGKLSTRGDMFDEVDVAAATGSDTADLFEVIEVKASRGTQRLDDRGRDGGSGGSGDGS